MTLNTQASDTEVLVAEVVGAFIETGEDMTVAEIAERLKWNESKVRKVMNDHHGCPDGLTCRKEARPSYSKNYRGMQSGTHQVYVYGPTRDTLRKALKFANEMLKIGS